MNLNKPFIHLAIVVVTLLLNLQCEPNKAVIQIEKQQEEVLSVTPSSDMSQVDAEKIMKLYLRISTTDCDEVTQIKDEGEYWVALPATGIMSNKKLTNPIRVHKASGAIAWEYGPTIPSLGFLVDASKKETLH